MNDKILKLINDYEAISRKPMSEIRAEVNTELNVDGFIGTKKQLAELDARVVIEVDRHVRLERAVYNNKLDAALGALKAEVFANSALTNGDTFELAWQLAWSEAHGSGLRDVVDYADTLADFAVEAVENFKKQRGD